MTLHTALANAFICHAAQDTGTCADLSLVFFGIRTVAYVQVNEDEVLKKHVFRRLDEVRCV
jgi:hypothetical protein